MKELRVKDPGPELVARWEKDFRERIDEEYTWLGETEYDRSVELNLLDGTRKPRSKNVERLEARTAEMNLYAVFADAEPYEINNQDIITDQRLQSLNRSFSGSSFPRDESAYLDSFYDVVSDVELTDCFMRPIVFSGLNINLDRASEIEEAMNRSEYYSVRHAEITSRSFADNALEAYEDLQENTAVQIVFEYENAADRAGDGFPGRVTVNGDSTRVELADIAGSDSKVENWVMEQY